MNFLSSLYVTSESAKSYVSTALHTIIWLDWFVDPSHSSNRDTSFNPADIYLPTVSVFNIRTHVNAIRSISQPFVSWRDKIANKLPHRQPRVRWPTMENRTDLDLFWGLASFVERCSNHCSARTREETSPSSLASGSRGRGSFHGHKDSIRRINSSAVALCCQTSKFPSTLFWILASIRGDCASETHQFSLSPLCFSAIPRRWNRKVNEKSLVEEQNYWTKFNEGSRGHVC